MRDAQTQLSKELRVPGLAETDFGEGTETAKIDLTYSATKRISRAGSTLGTLIVCIIQVALGPLSIIYVAFIILSAQEQ